MCVVWPIHWVAVSLFPIEINDEMCAVTKSIDSFAFRSFAASFSTTCLFNKKLIFALVEERDKKNNANWKCINATHAHCAVKIEIRNVNYSGFIPRTVNWEMHSNAAFELKRLVVAASVVAWLHSELKSCDSFFFFFVCFSSFVPSNDPKASRSYQFTANDLALKQIYLSKNRPHLK